MEKEERIMSKGDKLKVKRQQIRPFGAVYFGKYPQKGDVLEPLEWQVLCKKEDMVLLLSKNILNFRIFDKISTDWKNCELRTWLNQEFYHQAFSESEKKKMVNDEKTGDVVFILSKEEAESHLPEEKIERRSTPYAKAISEKIYGGCRQNYWWLRDAVSNTYQVCYVMGELFQDQQIDTFMGVVPAIWVRVKPE